MSPLLKNLVIALVVVLVAGAAYYTLKSDPALEEDAFSLSESEAVKQIAKTLSDTQKINTFNMENTMLKDERFVALQRVEWTRVEPVVGRSNPFDKTQ